MKNRGTKIFGILGFIALAIVLLTLTQPAEYRIERAVVVEAPAQNTFSNIVDLKKWEKWSPWIQKDPEMKISYSDPTFGEEAFSEWESASQGHGRQVITKAVENDRVDLQVEFFKPWEGNISVDFKIKDLGESRSEVSWGMTGYNKNFKEKLMYLFTDMDSLMGQDFEAGLKRLKYITEAAK